MARTINVTDVNPGNIILSDPDQYEHDQSFCGVVMRVDSVFMERDQICIIGFIIDGQSEYLSSKNTSIRLYFHPSEIVTVIFEGFRNM